MKTKTILKKYRLLTRTNLINDRLALNLTNKTTRTISSDCFAKFPLFDEVKNGFAILPSMPNKK